MSPAPTHRRSKSPRPSVAYTMSLRHVAPVGNGLSDNVVCDSRRLNTPLTNTTGCQSPGRLLQPTDRVVMIRSGVPRPVFSIWSSGSVEKPFKIIEKGAPGAVERPAQGDQHGDVGHVLASLDRGNPASAHVRPFSKLNAAYNRRATRRTFMRSPSSSASARRGSVVIVTQFQPRSATVARRGTVHFVLDLCHTDLSSV